MAFDPDEVIVAPFGHVYIAPSGTALPTDIEAALAGDWKDLGYLNEDGIQATFGLETTDIRAWQSETPIRRIVTARTGEIAVSLMEWSQDTVELAFGGGTWTDAGAGEFSYVFPTADDSIAEFAVLFDVEDGLTHLMFCFNRATVSGDVATSFVRGAAALLPVTFGLLADETTGAVGTIIGVQDLTS